MEKEEMLNNFIKTLTFLIKLNNQIEDGFLGNKLNIKINNLAKNFIHYSIENKEGAAEYTSYFYHLSTSIDNLIEIIEDIPHLGLLKSSPLLLEVEKYLLLIKLDIMKRNQHFSSNKYTENKKAGFVKNSVGVKVNNKPIKLNQSKLKILNFIKSYPDTRTKDIINEFSALSDRTVKRNLMELLKTGMIKKKIDNKATYYSHAENQ